MSIPAPPPDKLQEVLLLFSGSTVNERSILTLNNNRPTPLDVTATVYDSAGAATDLRIPQLLASESRVMELQPLLRAALVGERPLGYLKLTYSGQFLGMGAQLTLYPDPFGPGVDSPRSLAADFKTQERKSVFWLPPGALGKVALSNISDAPLSVDIDCGSVQETARLEAHGTAVRAIASLLTSAIDNGSSVSCDLRSGGSVSDLRVTGTVASLTGYSAPIRFYDVKTSTSSTLTAVGLDTTAKTTALARNLTAEPVTATLVLTQVGNKTPYALPGTPINIAAGSAAVLPLEPLLSQLRRKQITYATLQLRTTAPAGSLIGSVTQINSSDHLVEDIPFVHRTPRPLREACTHSVGPTITRIE